MFSWLIRLWHKIARTMNGEKEQRPYHRSNLHGRHR